jgi:hypothetical protein
VLNFRGGSVPSIGGTVSLASALARVEAAEQALSAARAAARAAAKAEGKSTRYLFDGHPYVARSSAEKWVAEARAEGWRDGHAFLSDALTRANRPPDPADPFYHLHLRLKRHEAEGVTPADLARLRDKMEARGAFSAMQRGDHQRAAEICAEIHREEQTGRVTGAAILKAARDRRMGGPPVPEPEKDSFAARVLAAGKKARRPTGSDE